MESIYTKLALYGSKNECAKPDNVFSPIAEVCDDTVSLCLHLSSMWHLTLIPYVGSIYKKKTPSLDTLIS